MVVKQLSVFLENKAGRINELTKVLGESGINMRAFSVSDNPEFGIMRIVVSGSADEAASVIKSSGFTVKLTDVLCTECSDTPGAMSAIMEKLASQGVFIEYMYAFADGHAAKVVLKPTNLEKCLAIIEE